MDREYLDEYLDIQLIARQTTAVGRLIYYPFAVLTLIIVSRISYFDNWNWPVVLVVLLATSVALLVICGRILRNSAEEARSQNLKSLRAVRQRAGAGARGLDAVIADIEQEKRGAFCPYLRNPILRAFLLPSGGVGIYALLELFAK